MADRLASPFLGLRFQGLQQAQRRSSFDSDRRADRLNAALDRIHDRFYPAP